MKIWQFVGATLLAVLGLACSENPVGRKCYIGNKPAEDNQNLVTVNAPECQSHTCLHVALPTGHQLPEGVTANNDLCTGFCDSDDECDKVSESPCKTGFACTVAVEVGDFCCEKMCVCKDYLDIPADGEIETPKACDPDDAANTCVNLPGRS